MKTTNYLSILIWGVCILTGCASPNQNDVAIINATQTVLPNTNSTPTQPTLIPKETLHFNMQDTGIRVTRFPGNIAWSHKGDRIAYTSDFALWIVPIGQWNNPSKVFVATAGWEAFPRFIAWSPDDRFIGLDIYKIELGGPRAMIQVDAATGRSVTLTTDRSNFYDWSVTNQIVTFRDKYTIQDTLAVLDLSKNVWTDLEIPPSIQQQYKSRVTPGIPRWTARGTILTTLPIQSADGSETAEYQPYEIDWQTNQWNRLPFKLTTSYSFSPPLLAPSPDGRWIAWITGDADVWKLMLYEIHTDTIIEAVRNDNKTFAWNSPTWSPDSKRIALSAGPTQFDGTIWILEIAP